MESGLVQTFDSKVSGLLSVLDKNQYISAALTIFLIVYASMAAPQLPEYIARLFDNMWFKLLILFLIAYSAQRNPTIAIIAAIGLMVTLQVLNRYKFNEMLMGYIKAKEHMQANLAESAQRLDNNTQMELNYIPNEETASVSTEAVEDLQKEQHKPEACSVPANFKNSFYPQYVDLKPDSYVARDSEAESVGAYDDTGNYANA